MCFQFKSEKDGVVETRIERKIVTSAEAGDDDDDFDIDHDAVSLVTRLRSANNTIHTHRTLKRVIEKMMYHGLLIVLLLLLVFF